MMSDQYRNLKRSEKDQIIESRKNPRSDQRKKLYNGGAVTFDTFEDLKRYGTKEDKESYVRKQKGLTAFETWKMMEDLGLFDKKKPVPKM
jgi:DNA-binding PadR family transcriptional regulator